MHAGLVAAIVRRHPPEVRSFEPGERSIELELLAEAESPLAPEEAAASERAGVLAPQRGAHERRVEPLLEPPLEPLADALVPSPSSQPSPAPPITLTIPSATPPDLARLGLGGPNRFVTTQPSDRGAETWSAAPAPPTSSEAKQALEASLEAGKNARDALIGLGPEGPILTALEAATSGSAAPEHGEATFLVKVDASGVVVDLRLLSSRGGERGWIDARDRAARTLTGQKLALRGAKGAELTVLVDSSVRLPSGARPDKPVSPTLEHSRIVQHESVPEGGTAVVVKAYTVGRFDLSDVRARATRIVHARVVSRSTSL
jgi:hypothetical protein